MDAADGSFRFEIAQRHPRLSIDEEPLRRSMRAVLEAEGIRGAEISLALTDDAEIRRINREFLGHDYPTDVISFPLSDEEPNPTQRRSVVIRPLSPVGERRSRDDDLRSLAIPSSGLRPPSPPRGRRDHSAPKPMSGETEAPAGKTPEGFLSGELIVSLETAERVASAQGWSLASEVVLYVVHGLLHLCGYDDLTELARPMMRKREREILAMLALPDGERLTAAGWEDGSS